MNLPGIHKTSNFVFFLFLFLSSSVPAQQVSFIPLEVQTIPGWIRSNSETTLLVVNVWASWCVPCREEFPWFMEAMQQFLHQPVRFVFISADFAEDTLNAAMFLDSLGFSGTSYRKTGNDQIFIENLHPEWSGALPATFIYDNGKCVFFHEGILQKDTLFNVLQNRLEEKSHD
jgi:thiol-disulfide isomerase/thioredoxin